MRHSEESSLNEALDSTKKSSDAGQFLYDATLSRVNPASSTNESRILTEKEEFNYRYPESLLAKYRESLANDPPRKRGELANASGLYGAPYGFLSGLSQLIRRVREGDSRPSLTYIYNSRPYTLSVQSVRSVSDSKLRSEWKSNGVQNVSKVRFRCFNTVKKTQTDFELWLPRAGAFKDIPVRILHQPRWWLRLQLDLDIPKSQ